MSKDRVTIDRDLANDIYSLLADVRDESWHQAKYARERIEAALASDEPDAEELLDWLGEQEGATLWSSKLEWISGWVMSPSVDSGEAVCSATPKACIRAAHAADKEKK